MKKTVRQFVHREWLVQVRVVDPNNLCEALDDSMYTDPVHPPLVFYEKLAARLIAMQEGEGFSPADRLPERGPEPVHAGAPGAEVLEGGSRGLGMYR